MPKVGAVGVLADSLVVKGIFNNVIVDWGWMVWVSKSVSILGVVWLWKKVESWKNTKKIRAGVEWGKEEVDWTLT